MKRRVTTTVTRITLTILLVALCAVRVEPVAADLDHHVYLPRVTRNSCYKEPGMSDWKLIVPIATTNLIVNPSFETNTTSWTGIGGNAIAQTSDRQKFGAYSLQCTQGDGVNVAIAIYAITFPAAGTYTFSAWVYLTPAWDAGAVSLRFRDFVGGSTITATTSVSETGVWTRLAVTVAVVGGDLVGNLDVIIASPAANSKIAYVDAAQVELQTVATTYADGDQPGCEWLGIARGSTSQRSAQSRAGGRIRDFKTDYGFGVSNFMNTGMPTQSTEIDNYALLQGGQLNDIKIEPRKFTLMGTLSVSKIGDCTKSLDELRAALEEELAHDRYPEGPDGWQPVLIRYTGADVDKEIAAHYSGGLEGRIDLENVIHEKMGLRFAAPDPNWYEIGQSAQLLDTQDTPTLRYATGRLRSTGLWDDLGLAANPTVGGIIWSCIAGPDGKTYYGGDFTGWGGIANRDYITRYDPATDTWETVGGAAAVGAIVRALAVSPTGTIIAGGDFVNVGGGAGDYVAEYDIATDTWSPISGGGTADVYALAYGLDGTLYIAGSFQNWNAIPAADRIVTWNGAAYAALGSGFDNTVNDLAVNPLTGDIVAVGDFANSGVLAVDGIALWDVSASAWVLISSGLAGGVGTGEGCDYSSSGILYFGGSFTSVDGVSANYAAQYNGQAWSPMGSGLDAIVNRLRIAPNDQVYVAGAFTTAGGIPTNRLAFWNGSSWAGIDVLLSDVLALCFGTSDPVVENNFDVWVGIGTTGIFRTAGSADVNNEGTAHTFPNFIVERDGVTASQVVSLRNETLGKQLQYDYALLDGERLTTFNHPLDQNIVSSFFGQRLDATVAGDDFGDWSLQPGVNQITAYVDPAAPAVVTAWLLFREAFKGHGD